MRKASKVQLKFPNCEVSNCTVEGLRIAVVKCGYVSQLRSVVTTRSCDKWLRNMVAKRKNHKIAQVRLRGSICFDPYNLMWIMPAKGD